MTIRFHISVAATLLCTSAVAQDSIELERIEQGFEDVSPLAESLEFFQPRLQLPTGFQDVYRVPDSDGLFMRRDGAIYAIFDRSEYIQTRRGTRSVVPPGTVFSIGPPSDLLLNSMSGRPARSLVSAAGGARDEYAGTAPVLSNLRISNRLEPGEPAENNGGIGTVAIDAISPSVWTSDLVRQRRLSALFGQLAEAQDSSASPATADD